MKLEARQDDLKEHMPNSNYSVNIFNDGSGNINFEVLRNPSTVASGGTGLTYPHIENTAQDGGSFRGGPFTLTAATNATPIVATVASTGSLQGGDVVEITGVVGNLGANGTFKVSSVTATQFTLTDSAGTGAWTSGGTVVVLRPTKLPYVAVEAAKRAILDDIASGN